MSTKPVDDLHIVFEGREIPCRDGMSLAAALAGAGVYDLGEVADHGRRGVFCGMGICQACRVEVDGQHGVRACMRGVRDGMQVQRDSLPGAAGAAAAESSEPDIREPDLLVIGGGPGGLSAAAVAAEAGLDVVVLDERSVRGGQYYKQPARDALLLPSLSDDPQIAGGAALVARADNSGARIVTGAEVWGAFAPGEFAVLESGETAIYKPRRTIVATGAYERGLPIPGWTLPGVMTTGATQGLLRNYGTVPEGRIVIAGNGPLNLQIALELRRAGADVITVLELSNTGLLTWLRQGLRLALNVPRYAVDGLTYLRGLKREGIPVRFGHGLVSVDMRDGALRATIGHCDNDRLIAVGEIDADVVCMGYGFQPSNEILRCLDCRHRYDDAGGQLVVERNDQCETSVKGVYAVGDCAGFRGAPAALQDGVIAASSVIRSLQHTLGRRHQAELARALRDRPRHRAFQEALWRIFSAPRFTTELATADTAVCRCESVTLSDINTAIADGAETMAGIKQRTRAGMGPCQGRYCAMNIARHLSRHTGEPLNEYSLFAPRSPLKPVRIADIVGTQRR